MPDEGQDVAPESSPADVSPDSSPVQDVQPTESQTAPALPSPSVAEPEEQRVPIDRFRDVVRERQTLQEQNQQLLTILQQARQAPAAPAQPPINAWDGLTNHPDPQTAMFYQGLQKVVQQERQLAKQEAVQELSPVIQAGMERLAQIDIRDFRRENAEIKPGSENERLIVSYMNGQMDGIRHPIESAKRNAMFESLKQENQQLKSKQSAMPGKRAANTEASAGIPQVSGLPAKQGSWQQRAGEILEKGGSFKDAANAIFG